MNEQLIQSAMTWAEGEAPLVVAEYLLYYQMSCLIWIGIMLVGIVVCVGCLRAVMRSCAAVVEDSRNPENHYILMGIIIMLMSCFGFTILLQCMDLFKARTAPRVVVLEKVSELLKERR